MPLNTQRRGALTMVELLIVTAVAAIILGLLMVAVVRVREAAARTESENKLRQIILATHHFAATHNGNLPTVNGDSESANPYQSVFVAILPFLDQGEYNRFVSAAPPPNSNILRYPTIMLFISPADPTAAEGVAAQRAISSYAANARVFYNNPRLPFTISDGVSNTIGFAEHYAYQCSNNSWTTSFLYEDYLSPGTHESRATFAEGVNIAPITSGNPPVSVSSFAGLTFQVAPARNNCNPLVAQTPHPSGMLAALMDGSVRTLAPNMAENTFWAAVTPAGGEMLGDDW